MPAPKKEANRISLLLKVSVFVLLACTGSFAQTGSVGLELNTPLNVQMADAMTKLFTVQLLGNQTARIEVEYRGSETLVTAYDPEKAALVTVTAPSGFVGRRVLLLTAEKDGLYTVEVERSQALPTKFKIELTEIRETTQNDKFVNETQTKINKLVVTGLSNPSTYQSIAEHKKAIELRREIIRLSKLIGDKYNEAQSLLFIGATYQSLGDMQSALDEWIAAREIYREMKRPDLEGLPVITIGSIYLAISEFEKAIEYFAEADKLLGAASPNLKAAILGLSAPAYYRINQHKKAIEYAEKSLAIYLTLNSKVGEMTMLGLLGTIYQDAKQPQIAIEKIEKALLIAKGLKKAQGVADLKIRLGILYWENGRKKEARDLLLEGKEIAELVGQKYLVVQSLYQLALVEDDDGNLEGAIRRLESGIEMIEQIRTSFQDKSQRASYFSTVQDTYELYTDLLIKRSVENKDPKDISLAFEMSERSRARSLIDLFEEARIDFRHGVDTRLLDEEKDLSNQLDQAIQSRLSLSLSESKQAELAQINSTIIRLTNASAALKLRIERESPRYAGLIRGNALATSEIQKLLGDETVLLEFKLGRERSFMWLVSRNSIKHFELPGRDEIENQVRTFYELTIANRSSDSAQIEKLSKDLNRVLLSQVSKEIKGKRVAIVAEGMLQYLPFSALMDEDQTYLADRNEIIVLPSASVLAELRLTPEKRHRQTVAIFADPVFDSEDSRLSGKSAKLTDQANGISSQRSVDFGFDGTLPRLLASRQEARNIAAFVGQKEASVKTDFDASLNNIQNSDLKGFRILHFATHGLVNTSKPELSGLVFSLYDNKAEPQNGFLDLNDIYNLDLSSDMVVLSACQTALGKDVRGEGLIGLSRGFLYAGSKRVVASLWKVDDSATAEFMKLFYKNHLQKGMPAASALRAAKLEMKQIRRYRSPYYWGAFTILGDWR